MFAIIKTGGKQYKVKEGQVLEVESLNIPAEESLEIRDVLLVDTGDTVMVGRPTLSSATVQASVVSHGQGDKVLIFKKKKKKQYRRLRGHRQQYTAIRIDKINV